MTTERMVLNRAGVVVAAVAGCLWLAPDVPAQLLDGGEVRAIDAFACAVSIHLNGERFATALVMTERAQSDLLESEGVLVLDRYPDPERIRPCDARQIAEAGASGVWFPVSTLIHGSRLDDTDTEWGPVWNYPDLWSVNGRELATRGAVEAPDYERTGRVGVGVRQAAVVSRSVATLSTSDGVRLDGIDGESIDGIDGESTVPVVPVADLMRGLDIDPMDDFREAIDPNDDFLDLRSPGALLVPNVQERR